MPGDDDDLDALAAARHIDVDDDELSDSSSIGTAKFSWCARSEFRTNDASSRSDRKFFFNCITKVLGTLRQIESSEHYQKSDDKTSAYVVGNSDKDYNCVLCGEQHKNKRGHQSQNLGLCSQFKNLKLLKEKDRKFVSLRGATGTGKTFVVANVIAEHDKPVLVVVPNKTLAAQVARELRGYLRTSHLVELFVSHFSVYIPESCRGGRYVEKRSAVDPDLDALRHRATRALVEAKSTNRTPVIVASVSCLYGLGLPSDFVDAALFLGKDGEVGQYGNAEKIINKLETECLYERAPAFGAVERGQFRTRNKGTDQVEIRVWPPYSNEHVDIMLDKHSGDFLEGKRVVYNEKEQQHETEYINAMTIWPRVHYVTPKERVTMAVKSINEELVCREHELREEDAVLEADRLRQRVSADLEMLRDIGWCPGAEHYSRHLRGANPGEPPVTLLDYFSHENNEEIGEASEAISASFQPESFLGPNNHHDA